MPTDNEDLSLSEEVRAAFEQASSEEKVTETEEQTTEESKSKERARDESGKFVAKQGEKETEAAARLEPKPKEEEPKPAEGEPKEPEAPSLLTKDVAPRGWSPAAREKWNTIDPELRKEILRREETTQMGVRQLQEQFAPMQNFVRSLDPYIQEARQLGADAGQYIAQTMATERQLRSPDIPTRFQTILRIADQYGVPLRDIINESVGAKVLPAAGPQGGQQWAIPPQLQQELQDMRNWRTQFEEDAVSREIQAFSEGKEFFLDVRDHMAVLLETGTSKDLQDAYDKACWAVPEVRQVLLERQAVAKKTDDLKSRQQAAASASVKPKGAIEVPTDDDEDDDLAETVRKQFAAHSGRV